MKAIITFGDFKKTFDSTLREIIDMISVLHADTCTQVITSDGETKEFQISKGVLQGDTLAPLLFVIVLDYAMRMAINDN